MANWNSRLVVKFTPLGGDQILIQPIDSFTPKIDTPHDIIDSIDAENIGYESKSRRFTFDFTARALDAKVMRLMVASAVAQTSFEIDIEQQNDSDEWIFDTIAFNDCRFTNVSPSDISNDGGAPTMSFSGVCLNVSMANGADVISPTNTTGATGTINA